MSNGYKLRLNLIGSPGSGKSSLHHRYSYDKFPPPQTDLDFYHEVLEIDSERVVLKFRDTPIKERFGFGFPPAAITPQYLREAQGTLVCFDLSDKGSFEEVEKWMDMLERHACSDNI